jgi:flagellar hook protein FlgE
MLDLYKSIKNTLGGLNSALRIAISNADNFNSPGFKYTFASFTTVYSTVEQGATEQRNPVQFAGSMTLGSTTTDFSQGSISFGTNMDAAIIGEGFFLLSRSKSNTDELVYSRSGRFQVDFNNKFVTDSFGRKLMGFKVDGNGVPISDELVPIETNGENDIGITDEGVLVADYQQNKDDIANKVAEPTEVKPLFKIALTTFSNKQGLILTEGTAWKETIASGEHQTPGQAKTGQYGSIRGASLESSNIDVSKIALDLALLNRGFSAVQGLIDDVNKILSGLISKLQ